MIENSGSEPLLLNVQKKLLKSILSFLSLTSNDKFSSLNKVYISTFDSLFIGIINFLDRLEDENIAENCLIEILDLLNENSKLILSEFGRRIIYKSLENVKLQTEQRSKSTKKTNFSNELKNKIGFILEKLKKIELTTEKKESLIFWRVIQDLLFDYLEKNWKKKVDVSDQIIKLAWKIYYNQQEQLEDEQKHKSVEKFAYFIADSINRGLTNDNTLLIFEKLTKLIVKTQISKGLARKLAGFLEVCILKYFVL